MDPAPIDQKDGPSKWTFEENVLKKDYVIKQSSMISSVSNEKIGTFAV